MIPDKNITESDIYKACIVLSVVGLATIHISQSYMTPEKASIDEIDETWLGKTVKINGTIENDFNTEGASFYSLKDSTGSINLVDFNNRTIPEKGSVTGHIDIYQGDIQIVLDEVKKTEQN